MADESINQAQETVNQDEIRYRFSFPDGTCFEHAVVLDPGSSLLLRPADRGELPEWTRLEKYRCPNCSLDASAHRHCPVAANLADIVATFRGHLSFQEVQVTVLTRQRSFAAATSLQLGLSSLIGLVMATSGCPVLDPFRPMARFHLPFATVEETGYRMVSMYLTAQYFRHAEGLPTDLDLEGLKEICEAVEDLNAAFALRLWEAVDNDANVNSLINLDCFAKATQQAVRLGLEEYRACFESYLE
ncbi:DUF6901 family protein [Geomesophilobacter sediminis]|uniref:Uncharacterized protein n=1 Tax=Geomesophilobacter sediminis TaxID=2798584 RepID=A0A8J7J0W0_9BACT|nr:hypothetical protein [Geomesophilobacter sediminis]MBJ6724123.1 hypothetical protein [Geomesophilobacter sediminis]